jgi:hypothetical protein
MMVTACAHVHAGAWVDHLRITTSKGNVHIFGGVGGVNEFNLPIPEKHRYRPSIQKKNDRMPTLWRRPAG